MTVKARSSALASVAATLTPNDAGETIKGYVYIPMPDEEPPAEVGGKARGLAQIECTGFATAPWFAITADAQSASRGRELPASLRSEIEHACHALRARGAMGFAVRSSALDEDGLIASFAGQHVTVLNALDVKHVLEAIQECWASATRPGALAYRARIDSAASSAGVGVVVQEMVAPRCAGVAFSRSPDAESMVMIAAVRGLGAPLVAGEVDGDEYRVGPDGCITVRRGSQEWRDDPDPVGGVRRRAVSIKEQAQPVLEEPQILRLAQCARRLEARLGVPQDVEWAFTEDGALLVLQTRPITTLGGEPASGELRLWDNANIVESFPGVTLPLTYSVAREAYRAVYPQACAAIGVSPRVLTHHDRVFEQMLGLIQGRVYYNLTSWYRVLSLLPGFRHNQRFMEQMMGTGRPGTRPGEESLEVAPRTQRVWEGISTTARLAGRLMTLDRESRRFVNAIDSLLAEYEARDLRTLGADELLDTYDELQRRALESWVAPILNDLYLMLFHGLLRRAAALWLGPTFDALVNAALPSGHLASAAPGEFLAHVARHVRADPMLCQLFATLPDEQLVAAVRSDTRLAAIEQALEEYLRRWGHRCPEELKLERPSYRDDPEPLLRTLRQLVSHEDPRTNELNRSVPSVLGPSEVWNVVPRLVLRFLLGRTRHHLQWREEMRFARGHVFGMARGIFSALGEDLHRRGVLETPRDVHYLDVQEIRALVRGTGPNSDTRALLASRQAAYESYGSMADLPSRFQTIGPVNSSSIRPAVPTAPDGAHRELKGIGASPGRVRAPAVVALDARTAPSVDGRILVARSTDPGWVPLFTSVAGLAVERGSLLSHSAIVARELGIPTVVGIPNLTKRVRTGDVMTLDGATGEILLEPGADGVTTDDG